MRMSERQRQLISRAAAAVDKTDTDFMLEASTTAAERVLADRRWFTLSEKPYKQFEKLLDAPVPYEADLRELLRERTVFDT